MTYSRQDIEGMVRVIEQISSFTGADIINTEKPHIDALEYLLNNADDVISGLSGSFDDIIDPTQDAAVTTAKVDAFDGTTITTTTESNSQTIASPTDTTAGKLFIVCNSESSTD